LKGEELKRELTLRLRSGQAVESLKWKEETSGELNVETLRAQGGERRKKVWATEEGEVKEVKEVKEIKEIEEVWERAGMGRMEEGTCGLREENIGECSIGLARR
jgi:hypothetical protein